MSKGEETFIEDGGDAFPQCVSSGDDGQLWQSCDALDDADRPRTGMSLRDYFAAKAMAGMLANPDLGGDFPVYARDAYRYADAMLKARGGGA